MKDYLKDGSKAEYDTNPKIFPKGNKMTYDVSEIDAFHPIAFSKKNFFSFMEDSFWVLGGQRIYFNYGDKKVILGMQLSVLETKRLLSLLTGHLKLVKRNFRAKLKQQKKEL